MIQDKNTLLIAIIFCILVQGITNRSYSYKIYCNTCNLLSPICSLTGYNQCIYWDGGPFKNLQLQCALNALTCAPLPIIDTISECPACPNTCCQRINNGSQSCVSPGNASSVCKFGPQPSPDPDPKPTPSNKSYTMTISCKKCDFYTPFCRDYESDQCIYYDGGPFSNKEIQCAQTIQACALLPIQDTFSQCSLCPDTCCQSRNNGTQTCVARIDRLQFCKFTPDPIPIPDVVVLGIGIIIAIVIGSIVFIIAVSCGIFCLRKYLRRKRNQLYTNLTS